MQFGFYAITTYSFYGLSHIIATSDFLVLIPLLFGRCSGLVK